MKCYPSVTLVLTILPFIFSYLWPIKKTASSLHFFSAASFGNPECVELLLKNTPSIDSSDVNGMTPFLCAVVAGHANCAKMLLESGAEIAARDKYQRCCVHLAVENNKEDVLRLLLERCGSGIINFPDVLERTPLHYAASSTNIKVRPATFCSKTSW